MDGRRLRVRRLTLSLVIFVLAAAWAGSPTAAKASCASIATLEQSAQDPGVAIFAGRATGEMPESGDVVFAVDRWFHGPHAAREVRLLALVRLRRRTADRRGDPGHAGTGRPRARPSHSSETSRSCMVAARDPASGAFGPQACGLAGVPLDSPEGREALGAAVALFGPGRPAVELPSTDALDPGTTTTAAAPGGASDWRPVVLVFALGAGLVLARRRIAG